MSSEGLTKKELLRELEELRLRMIRLVAREGTPPERPERPSPGEDLYRGIFDNTRDGVAVYRAVEDGRDFVFVDFNKAGERIERVRREDVIGKSVVASFPGVAEFGFLDVLRRVWATGTPERFPLALYRDDRIEGWRDNFVYKLRSGEVVAVYSDETDRMRAEEGLRRYERIVSAAREHMALLNRGYVYEAVNDAYLRAHERRREDVIGRPVWEIHGEEFFRRELKRRYDRCLAGEEVSYRAPFQFPKLGRRYMDVAYYPYFEGEGTVSGVVIAARDVTEVLELEGRLHHAQKMEAIGTLAGGIAHDFNNVLMGIQGHMSVMLLDPGVGPSLREKMLQVEEYVRNGAHLTKGLLGFARGGKYEARPTDLNDVLHRTSAMFGRTKKELTITVKPGQGIWPVEADRSQIEQVLVNLYVNAWQAMPGGGELFLETRNVTLPKEYVEPYGAAPGRYVRISVTDTGVGMDEATRQRVFEPFFTTKEVGMGTGLGLASVYGIVTNHGGMVNCYSEPGKGATFNVYLPASEGAVSDGPEERDGIVRGTGTILVADDEEMVLEVTEKMVRALGYGVLTARGGKEAVEVLRRHGRAVDAVILDMIMPGMGGGETFSRLREIAPGVKILLASGYSMNDQASEMLARGCDGFIQKPYDLKELSRKLHQILGSPGGGELA